MGKALEWLIKFLLLFCSMAYIDLINNILSPKITENEVVLDLFSGCGGLALGFEAVGFETVGFEMDAQAVETYKRNLSNNCYKVKLNVDFEYPKANIIIGGPPCQPFSVGGHQKGIKDERDGFPVFIDAVKKVEPRVFMFENVRGLLYSNKWYFDMILQELESLGYLIEYQLLNAVNFGIPQNRERLVVIGHKSTFTFPPRFSQKVIVQEAIGDLIHGINDETKFLTPAQDKYIAKYEKASFCINPRDLNPNKPSRTLTCRNLAAATGDMQRIRLQDGRRRRLTVREAARLQSFPDWFEFSGNETSQFYQIGNAVPPLLSFQLAECLKQTYNSVQLSREKIKEQKLKKEEMVLT